MEKNNLLNKSMVLMIMILILGANIVIGSQVINEDRNFITVISPNGGEFWYGTQNIELWIDEDIPFLPFAVTILYSNSDDETWITIVEDYEDLINPYQWDTTTIPDGNHYLIMAILKCDEDLDGTYESIWGGDISDSYFSVVNGPWLEVGISDGFIFTIKNVGIEDATDINYNFNIKNGFFFFTPREKTGMIELLQPNASFEIEMPTIGIGLGIITDLPEMIITAECAEGASIELSFRFKIFFRILEI